ncbi:hypothetical protein KW790_00625 [Candidatus Parcubacteria bacterium]|nr:hypothetical protein [Candidatus Parcubacteria bacterium]
MKNADEALLKTCKLNIAEDGWLPDGARSEMVYGFIEDNRELKMIVEHPINQMPKAIRVEVAGEVINTEEKQFYLDRYYPVALKQKEG